ncbi:MAG: vitamin K epoxide reductase family protein [Actinomycetaceae bacterium]|nr:vitamin K epoxide reductase family protein [Actinomycetaceae bacterium]
MKVVSKTAIALALLGVAGGFAALQLILTEIKHYKEPGAALSCDINPLVGCSNSLTSPQAHLLGIPNATVGLMAFSALLAFALLAIFTPIPAWIWKIMVVPALAGWVAVGTFLYFSVTIFHALCPWCLVVWAVTIPIGALLLAKSAAAWSTTNPVAIFLAKNWWAITALLYFTAIISIVVGMRTQLQLVLP